MAIQSINPSTGKLLKEFSPLTTVKIEQTLRRATESQKQWARQTIEQRVRFLHGLLSQLKKDKDRLARLAALEMGKPITQGIAEIDKCVWATEYFAQHAADLLEIEKVSTGADKSYVRLDPLGVVLAIMPWNFPFWQVIRMAIPVVVAGNVVLVKHASNVPQCALAIQKLFERAGFPRGVFQTVLIETRKIPDLIADDRIQGVTVTGSVETGSKVAALAGRAVKKTVMELGGSDPFIVLADADLKKASEAGARARLFNTGQSCSNAKRFIVVKKVAKEFTDLFIEHLQANKIGNPLEPSTDVGPLATREQLARLDRQVKSSVRRGAKILLGGRRIKLPGFFYQPTVLSNVRRGMPVYHEEVFGPVASIIIVSDEKEALRVANDTVFGLGASIWTRDIARAEKMAAELLAGVITINGRVRSDPRLPFGGVKKSGYGRELGSYGIREFVTIKTVVINPSSKHTHS
jgi:succinate-semialdehyde dehydrogenase/glutarate-semialdehyde dehydrogenase